jgi:uncharacterized RDD family membrane protein YckC
MAATATYRVSAPRVPYAGVVTRGIALIIDAAIANAIVLIGVALLALVATLVGDLRPQWLVGLIAASGWVITVTAYFALFWTATGQTPGMRLMHVRVVTARGAPLHLVRSLVRVGGLALAIIPLFAGFLPVLVDGRRRGLHDLLAGTVVLHVPQDP